MFDWNKKKMLAEQLRFFGAKKQSFISCYARKPRILVRDRAFNRDALLGLRGDVLNRGMRDSHCGYLQIQQQKALQEKYAGVIVRNEYSVVSSGLLGGIARSLLGGEING